MRTRIKVTVVNGVVRKVNTMKTLFGEARGDWYVPQCLCRLNLQKF